MKNKYNKLIQELRSVVEKQKNTRVFIGQINISTLCSDIADKMEEYLKALINLNEYIDELIDVAHETSLVADSAENKAKMEGEVSAYWNVKNLIENLLQESENI